VISWFLTKRAQMRKEPRLPVGTVAEPIGSRRLDTVVRSLGEDGRRGRSLEAAARRRAQGLGQLSWLSEPLLTSYVERLGRPLKALSSEGGRQIGVLGYAAHLCVEGEPERFVEGDIPVLGALPPKPPGDLANRVVRASRKDFAAICALSSDAWEAFVNCSLGRVQHLAAPAGGTLYLSGELVDGLLRFGWVLRQVDLHYGLEPPTGEAGQVP
jgi:hypothetical protein